MITFYKYHGTGNDFVLIDNRNGTVNLSSSQVAAFCHRRTGIGADGLMLLQNADGYDFRMEYYNADGNESSMCGNGGRCIAAFARYLGIATHEVRFLAIDGAHIATFNPDHTVSLHMQDVPDMEVHEGYTVLNTGSPHYVRWQRSIADTDVVTEGRKIRNLPQFGSKGINVNFVAINNDRLSVRTYERGVEDETMSCGTGVTAAAIAATCHTVGVYLTHIDTPGGKLTVSFTKDTPTSARDIVLTGPAVYVYKGFLHAD